MSGMDENALLIANDAFYAAFAGGRADLMADIWSSAANITCIHPGWGCVSGREAVLRSWESILANPPDIACKNLQAFTLGDVGYVVCFEALGEGRLIATNFFQRERGEWKMIHHQAGVTRPDSIPSRKTDHQVH